MKEALERLDALMNRLVEADQTGAGIEPLRVAAELGAIRQLLAEAPAVIRAAGGQRHFRCEACGTIAHGAEPPERCPTCGASKFFAADIEQPFVESGAG
jgi:rubrerythrin